MGPDLTLWLGTTKANRKLQAIRRVAGELLEAISVKEFCAVPDKSLR